MFHTKKFTIFTMLLLSIIAVFQTKPAISVLAAEDSAKENTSAKAYGIGSVSKMYTTAAVMKLAEQGKIDLDAPLITYIPEFTMADERYQDITPKMLLNHTSGLMGTTDHNGFTFGPSDTRYHDHILEELKIQTLKADPGSFSVYCNDGFTLAELLVERVSKMSFSEYVKTTFYEPLGIRSTFTPVYQFNEETIQKSFFNAISMPYVDCHLIGSGGIYSTASDVAKFGQIFTDNGSSLLSKESTDLMAKPWYLNDTICAETGDTEFAYGLGWDCVDAYPYNQYGLKALTKGGSVITYNAALVVLPEQNLSASMLISGGSGSECTYALQDIILSILEEEGVIKQKDLSVSATQTIEKAPLPDEMRNYAGNYLSTHMLNISFTADGTLSLEALDDDSAIIEEYVYTKSDEFVSSNGYYINSNCELVANDSGNKGRTKFHFKTESNGNTYMIGTSYETLNGLGESACTMTFAQKAEGNTLPESIQTAWESRNHNKYFLTDSVYNSGTYMTNGILELELIEDAGNYIKPLSGMTPSKILTANTAFSDVLMPTMLGRDLCPITFTEEQGFETLTVGSLHYLDESGLNSITSLPSSLSITKSEEAIWYKIDDTLENGMLAITVPEDGAYYVYDEDRNLTATSISPDVYEYVVLPAGGYLAFVGEKGSTFHITR